MTEVVILAKIAGYEPGDTAELDDRLQKHVDAGNAKLLVAEGGTITREASYLRNDPHAAPAHLHSVDSGDELEDDDLDDDTEQD